MSDELLNDVARARGVLQVQADTYMRQRDTAVATLEYLLAALDGGSAWEIDAAMHGATLTVNNLKERP